MAECTYCKTETELSYSGVPVCLKCERERYPEKPLFIPRPPDKTPPSDSGTHRVNVQRSGPPDSARAAMRDKVGLAPDGP